MSKVDDDARVQKLLDQIADPTTTEKQLKLLKEKLKVLRGSQ